VAPNTIIDKLHDRASAFRADRAGNVVITFALALVPLVGFVGAAIDYGRANSVKAAMQSALDAAALMLAKDAPNLNNKQLRQKADDYFKAEFHRPEARKLDIDPHYDRAKSRLRLTGSAVVDTTFTRVLGHKHLAVGATSEVTTGTNKRLEIALVLDNTGSMANHGRIEALIDASRQFLDTMKKASKKADDVKIAVVPFDTHVNIGAGFKNASWIDWSLMGNGGGGGWGDSTRGWDGSNNYGDADDDSRYDDDRASSWNGCVIDRAQANDVQDTAPTGNPSSWYPAENCTLSTLLPLTSDWTQLHGAIDKMKASGKTNLTIGLVWGWHALSTDEPLTGGSKPSKDVEKIMVFLTDGLNTQNRWTTKAAEIDKRTTAVCSNIKAAGIRLYTVRMMEGNEPLLRACASAPSMYYNVTAASQLAPAFEAIAKTLTQLRIAR
jgi:Flp pilus assembly protein TadG